MSCIHGILPVSRVVSFSVLIFVFITYVKSYSDLLFAMAISKKWCHHFCQIFCILSIVCVINIINGLVYVTLQYEDAHRWPLLGGLATSEGRGEAVYLDGWRWWEGRPCNTSITQRLSTLIFFYWSQDHHKRHAHEYSFNDDNNQ